MTAASFARRYHRVAMCAAITLPAAGALAANPPASHAIEGRWAGTSICTDRVAAPNCKDETVRYTFAPGGNAAEPVHLVAEKIVAGKYEVMYEMDFLFDSATGSWRHDWTARDGRYRWSYRIVSGRLLGEARQLATNARVRSVAAERVAPGDAPAP